MESSAMSTKQACLTLAVITALLTGTVALHAQTLLTASIAEAALPNSPSFVIQQTASEVGPSGAIQGIVTDVRGGLVPGANIKLQSKTPSVLEQEAITDSNGRFAFSAAPGTYTVLIQAKGLETFLSEPFTLHPSEKFEVPDVALPIASVDSSIEVSANSAQVAEQELKIETKQRVLGVFPNFYTSFLYNAAPLNTRQKFKLSLRSTMDPISFLNVGIVAAIEQANGTFKDFGPGPAGYGRRYGAALGDELIGRTLGTAVFPSLFHQDPRYFFEGPANSIGRRIFHAVRQGLVVRGDNGHLQPNYSRLLGNASAGAISSLYHPDVNGPGQLALTNALVGIGGTAVTNLLREFVLSHATTHVPSYAKGKPANLPEAPAETPAPIASTPVPAKP
jgi:hypothetical protein